MSVLPNILKLLKNQIEILEIKSSIKKIKNDLARTGIEQTRWKKEIVISRLKSRNDTEM